MRDTAVDSHLVDDRRRRVLLFFMDTVLSYQNSTLVIVFHRLNNSAICLNQRRHENGRD